MFLSYDIDRAGPQTEGENWRSRNGAKCWKWKGSEQRAGLLARAGFMRAEQFFSTRCCTTAWPGPSISP